MSIVTTFFKTIMVLISLILITGDEPVSSQQTKWPNGAEDCGDTSRLMLNSNGRARWFPPKEMNAMAISRVVPKFPKSCRCQGTIVIAVMVNVEGKVECARKISGHPLLTDAGIDAAKQWVFKPAKKDGRPASFVGLLSFRFESYGRVSF